MIADGLAVPRDRITVDATGVTIALPAPAATLRLSFRDVYDLRTAIESAGLAAYDDADLPAALFSTDAQEGE